MPTNSSNKAIIYPSGTSHTNEKTRVVINMNYIKDGGK